MTQITAEATGGSSVRGSRGRGREGPHHHRQDITIFFPTAKAAFIGKLISRDDAKSDDDNWHGIMIECGRG